MGGWGLGEGVSEEESVGGGVGVGRRVRYGSVESLR